LPLGHLSRLPRPVVVVVHTAVARSFGDTMIWGLAFDRENRLAGSAGGAREGRKWVRGVVCELSVATLFLLTCSNDSLFADKR
jgi:hypothetical protein